MKQEDCPFMQSPSAEIGFDQHLTEEPESPRIDFLISELRTALSITRAGLRADGLYSGEIHYKLSFDSSEIEIVPLPVGVCGPMLPLLQGGLEDQGFVIRLVNAHSLQVVGYNRSSPHIH